MSVSAIRALAAQARVEDEDVDFVDLIGETEWPVAAQIWAYTKSKTELGVWVNLVYVEETLWDVSNHDLVPRHFVLEGSALTDYVAKMGGAKLARSKSPVIFANDPQVRRIHAKIGDFVQCDRPSSDGSGFDAYVRVVKQAQIVTGGSGGGGGLGGPGGGESSSSSSSSSSESDSEAEAKADSDDDEERASSSDVSVSVAADEAD